MEQKEQAHVHAQKHIQKNPLFKNKLCDLGMGEDDRNWYMHEHTH